jgi:hypothetical protein
MYILTFPQTHRPICIVILLVLSCHLLWIFIFNCIMILLKKENRKKKWALIAQETIGYFVCCLNHLETPIWDSFVLFKQNFEAQFSSKNIFKLSLSSSNNTSRFFCHFQILFWGDLVSSNNILRFVKVPFKQ